MSKKILIVIAVVTLVGGGFLAGKLSSNARNIASNNEVSNNEITNDESKVEDESTEHESELPDIKVDEEKGLMKKETKFEFKQEEGSGELSFGTPWKDNSDKSNSIAIEGRGPEAIEEGIGFIYLKQGDEIKSLAIGEGGENLAPKYVEWYDDDTFLIYMVNRYGRVFTGGTLYMVDVDTLKPIIVYQAKEGEEISEATKISADIINIKMLEHKEEAIVSVEKNIKTK